MQISEHSEHINVDGHEGTWYVIDKMRLNAKDYFLLEHETYGDEAASVIVDEGGALVVDDDYEGFDDLIEHLADHMTAGKQDAYIEQYANGELSPYEQKLYDVLIDMQAARKNDEYQAEYGADGYRAFGGRDAAAPDRQRLFVDMDGTIAVFTPVDQLEKLYEKGWFEDAKPMDNVLQAVKQIVRENPDIEVSILSAYLSDSKYALDEKNRWLDLYLPEVDPAHRVFVPCGSDKKDYIPGGLRSSDSLLDDYTKNLTLWQPPARGIKLLNGINDTHGTWKHDKIRFDEPPTEIANNIVTIMHGEERVLNVDLPQASKAGIVGVVSWANGEKKAFTDSAKYIAEIKEEIDYSSSSGFKYKTITRDPETRKAVDDIVYGLYGEKNPNDLEYYRQLESEYPESDLERVFSTLYNDRGIEAEVVKEAYNQGRISDSLMDDRKDFRLYGRDDVTSVAIFSDSLNALSHASISRLMTNDFESVDRIAPTGNVFAYLKKHLDDNPGIKNIMLCTNADQAGKLKDKLLEAGYTPENGYHCERQTPTGCADYNEYLLTYRETQEGQRTADQEKKLSAAQEEDGFFPEAEPE
ncbi:MAG: hypothetical protein VB064_11625 [Oscillospiraceae bacterium]|nr:hypothetical protein [Oscillospiraceae bacterium]